jgi:hypothetical protein
LNQLANDIDEFARRKAAGDFHEPLDLQRRSHDPSQDRGRGVGCGIAVAGFSISARTTSDEGLTQTASTRVMKAGKPVVITSSGNSVVR